MIYFGDDKMPDFCSRSHPFHYATALNLLMKMGVNVDRVEILAVGEYENYKGEVREQQPAPATPLQAGTKIVLKVGYPGAVDQLPYQFFYGLADAKPRGGEWEINARKMMAPYDAAVVRHEAVMRYQALRFSFGVADEEHLNRFLDLFAFDRNGEAGRIEDMIAWASLMPAFYQWGGNADYTCGVLRLIFGYKFRIIENIRSDYEIPDGLRYRLGTKSGRLGLESVIGRSFAECDTTYQVVICGVTRQEMVDFLPGGKTRKKLEWALSLCMPNDLNYRITFDIENRAMVVGAKDEGTYLGYSTHLQRGEDRRRYRRRHANMAAQ